MKSKNVVSCISGLPFNWSALIIVLIFLPSCFKTIQPMSLSLTELFENYKQYEHSRVELKGKIVEKDIYGGYGGFYTWNFTLEAEGKRIRCYETHYRLGGDTYADDLVLMAMADQEKGKEAEVTIIGDLERDGVELYSIEYQSIYVRTDIMKKEELKKILIEEERGRM